MRIKLNKTLKVFLFCLIFKSIIYSVSFFSISNSSTISLCQWDCAYYSEIAINGYSSVENTHHFAFFPAFPLLMKLGKKNASLNYEFIVFINLILSSLGYMFLYLWIQRLDPLLKNAAGPILLLALADRFSFWSFIPYTESLFFALLFASLYFYRSPDSKRQYLSFLIAGLASGVRVVGFSLGFGFFISKIRQKLVSPKNIVERFGMTILLAIVSIFGLLGYMVFLYTKTENPLFFLEAQQHWGRDPNAAGFFASVFSLLKSFYWPTVPLLFLTLWGFLREPRLLNLNEKLCFSLMYLIPLTTSSGAVTRFFSLIPAGYVFLIYFFNFQLRTSKMGTLFVKLLFGAHMSSEILWQILLAQKYFKGEFFKWIG